ncbi:MAG TPA: hypothetical protein VJX30_17045 [Terriglobales bacterium]|nr:hypothetical protein [Terriglobales bacterium]
MNELSTNIYSEVTPMITRDPANDKKLLQDQYVRLKDALEGFYSGKEVQALNIAITLRVLVHETSSSGSLLSRLHQDYWDLPIRHKPPHPRAVFAVPIELQIRGDGIRRVIRRGFDSPSYQLVPLRQWWNGDYQPLGKTRLSKKSIVLNVADKDGGAHVDSKVPNSHATLSEPPFRLGMKNGEQELWMQPNLAYGITAEAGCEIQDYLERHFPHVRE